MTGPIAILGAAPAQTPRAAAAAATADAGFSAALAEADATTASGAGSPMPGETTPAARMAAARLPSLSLEEGASPETADEESADAAWPLLGATPAPPPPEAVVAPTKAEAPARAMTPVAGADARQAAASKAAVPAEDEVAHEVAPPPEETMAKEPDRAAASTSQTAGSVAQVPAAPVSRPQPDGAVPVPAASPDPTDPAEPAPIQALTQRPDPQQPSPSSSIAAAARGQAAAGEPEETQETGGKEGRAEAAAASNGAPTDPRVRKPSHQPLQPDEYGVTARVKPDVALTSAEPQPALADDAAGAAPLPAGPDASVTTGALVRHGHAAAHAPLFQAAQDRAPAEQLAAAISRRDDGDIELRLDPPELGRVRMLLGSDSNGLTATITAERPEVVDLMRRHAEILQRALADAGHGGAALSFGSENGGSRPRYETADAAGPYGRVDAEAAAPQPVQPRRASSGIDIRV